MTNIITFHYSRAILCYLVNKYGDQSTETEKLYPKDPELRANVDRMLFYDSGSLYKNVIDYFVSIFDCTCIIFMLIPKKL